MLKESFCLNAASALRAERSETVYNVSRILARIAYHEPLFKVSFQVGFPNWFFRRFSS